MSHLLFNLTRTILPAITLGTAAFFIGGPSACAQTPAAKPPPVDTTRYSRTFDIFAGQNKTGPYTLGWSGLHISFDDKPVVIVDGNTVPTIAYDIDAVKGTITFVSELKATQVARVAYGYNPAASVRNTNPASSPLSVSLLQMGSTALQVTALPAGSGTDSRPLVWSLSKKMGLMGGGLSSDVHYSGSTGTAWKMGYDRGTDQNGITANFEQAGRDFATKAGKAFNVTAPAQTWEAGGRLRPANWMGLQIKRRELRDLALQKSGVGTNNETLGLVLGGNAKNVPSLSLVRTEDEALPGNAAKITDSTTTTTDKIDFAGTIGGAAGNDSAAKIAAKLTQTELNAPGQTSDTKADEIAVSLSAQTPDKKGQASLAIGNANNTTATTSEDKKNIVVKISPAPLLTLSAEQKAQKNGPSDALVDAAQTALSDARAKGDTKAEASAEAAVKKLAPVSEVIVQTAQAELTPLPNTKITGSIQTTKSEKTDTPDAVKFASSDLSAQIGTGKAVEITGGFTNRSATSTGDEKADAIATLNTTRARLALRPFGPALILSGGYTINPLGKDNATLGGERQEYNVDAKIGALTLGSGYALTTVSNFGPLAGTSDDEAQYGEVSLTLGLRFSRYTKLSGSYKDALLYGGADERPLSALPRSARSYGLGLTHQVGSGLSFTMGGTVARDPAQAGKPADIKGEAKLGVKF